MLVLKRFLLDSVAARLSRFLTVETEFLTVYSLYSADGDYVTEEEWRHADESDRLLKFGAFSGARPEFQLSPNLLTYLRFRTAFRDPKFAAFFEEVAGSPLGSIAFSVHAMRTGDFLRPHTDALENRRLAFVLYLSPHWPPRFGGALHVVDHRGKASEIDAEYNALVIFDVTAKTKHFIAPIEPVAGETRRLSLGGWIHQPE